MSAPNPIDLLEGCITRVHGGVISVGRTSEEDADRAVDAVRQLEQAARSGANYLRKISDPLCPPAIRQVALEDFAEKNDAALALFPEKPA